MKRYLGLAAALLLLGTQALAKELPAQVRRWAERAFLEGRLDDLDTILAGAVEPTDRFPLLLRDAWWRASPPTPRPADPAPDLIGRRGAWLREPQGPYPTVDGGGADPHPILTALVQDRLWRERIGKAGLPDQGALKALARSGVLDEAEEARAIYFLGEWTNWLMVSTYQGPPLQADQRRSAREAEALVVRNGRWAWLALGGFGALVLLLAWAPRLSRRCRPGGPHRQKTT